MPIRIGVQVQPQHTTSDGMREAWRGAEALGVDTISTRDHFSPLYGEPDGSHLDSLTTPASLADVTERAQLGALKVTLKRVAQHADRRHGFGDPDTDRAMAAILAGHCADVGRDPAEITHTTTVAEPRRGVLA